MRIALIGANGQLGTDLQSCLRAEVTPLGHRQIELADEASVVASLDAARPDVVINTAAYNLVDRAEDEAEAAYSVNSLGPRRLAQYCGTRGLVLVHFSTDYVFGLDATRTTAYSETDAPGPLGVYGASKLLGEYFVQAACPKHYVIRTCGLYGVAARSGAGKGNFIETMLRLGRERPELRVVNDQVCTPTSTADLAAAVADLITSDAFGLYHATNQGQMSWYELACEALRLRGISTPVIPISSSEFRSKSRRPNFSVLDCAKLEATLGRTMPSWQDAVARYLDQPSG